MRWRLSSRIASRVRILCRRSASLTMMTRMSRAIASSILRKFSACADSLVWYSSRSSLDRPSTRSAMVRPNFSLSVGLLTPVSSSTSCISAAAKPCASRRQSVSIAATASGWVM
ncbi:hypothetical protein D3C72_1748460 [compost metagenome]